MSDRVIVDELDRVIDVQRTLDAHPPKDPDAGTPPSLVDLADDELWPIQIAAPPRLFHPAGVAESRQRLADYLHAESAHRDGPLGSLLAGEAGRRLIQDLGQNFQGQALIQDCGSDVPGQLIAATVDPLFDLTAALEDLTGQASDPLRAPAERAAAWIEHGLLCEERAGEPDRALASYRAALGIIADHPIALSLATQVADSLGREDLAVPLLTTAIDASAGPIAATYRLEKAMLTSDLDDRRSLLEEIVAGDTPDPTAIRRLLPLVRACGDRRHLSALYRRYASVVDEPVAAGIALHQALTALGETPLDAEATITALHAWLDANVGDITSFPVLTELIRTLEQQRLNSPAEFDDARYVTLLERLAPFVDDLQERAVIREQLARLRWTSLGDKRPDPPTADDILAGKPHLSAEVDELYTDLLADLRFCLEHQPEQRWIRDTLAAVLRDLHEIDKLIDHLEGWAHIHSAGPGRAAILMRLGSVHETLRRDLASAAETYELAVAEDPRNPNCLRALGRVYEEMMRWPQAVETLQRQADASDDPPERLAALRRLAALAEHELGDIDLALETLEEVARLDQEDILSLYQLAALSRANDRPKQLLSALELLVERLDDDDATASTLFEIGEAQEGSLADVDAAAVSYERALQHSPGYTPALRALARIYRGRDDYDALLGLHDPEVDPITDPAVLALKAARICLDELSDTDLAIERLLASYNLNPDLAPTRVLLLQLLTLSGRQREAYDLLRAQDPPLSAALLADFHVRLGLLAEDLASTDDADPTRDNDRALQHYRAALATQPDHAIALERTRSLLVANHDVDNLIRFVEEQLPHLQGVAKAGHQTQLARLYLSKADGQATARRFYEGAIESAPADAILRREFENLLRQTDDTKDLPTIRLALARISEDTHYKATLLVESAEALLISGADEDREFAANAILGALREDPGNPYAVRQLEGLLSDPSSPVAMTDAVGARAVRAQSDSERAIFYLESAELLERAGARSEAQRAYRAALRAMPSLAPAEMGLTRIASGADQVSESAPKTKAVSIHTLMADARDAAVRAGTSGEPRDAEEALNLLGQILGRDPHYRDAIGLTRALAAQLPDPAAAVNLLSTVYGRITDAALRYEIGVFLGEQSTSDENALAYFQVAADARPDGKQALRGLLRRHQRVGNEEASAEVMERLLALYDPGEPSAIDLRLTLANYLARSTKTLDRALEHARIVLQARSDDPRALLLMAELLERSQMPSEAVEMLDRLVSRERAPDKLHELHTRRARLLADLPGRDNDALTAAERAAELNPGDRATILLLIRLLDRTGQTDRVSAFLGPIRNAMLSNIGRGQINPGDLKLLSEVAHGTKPALARMARLLGHALEMSSGMPPEGHMQAATVEGLERILATPTLRTGILSPLESPDLNDLLTCIETAVERAYHEFGGLRPEDLVPIPPNVNHATLAPVINRWGALLGCNPFLLNACTSNNLAVLFEEGEDSSLRFGINLWLRGDEVAWRGLSAIALARKALGGVMVRALSGEELDLVLAASFETAKVFNAITADPDSHRLRELSGLFAKLLGRRQRKTLLRVCHSLASINFEPTSTARGTLASDLRMAAIISGDVSGCLSAACLLDGFANGSLKQRISFSRNAQELIVFLLSDVFLNLREIAIA